MQFELYEAFLSAGIEQEKAKTLAIKVERCVLAMCDEAAVRHGLITPDDLEARGVRPDQDARKTNRSA